MSIVSTLGSHSQSSEISLSLQAAVSKVA